MKKVGLVALLAILITAPIIAGGSSEEQEGSGASTLSFWEHFETFSSMNADLFAEYKEKTGIDIEYTLASPDKMTESLYVAYRSNQLPDIFSAPFADVSQLFSEDWIQPMNVDISSFSEEIQSQLFDGLSTKDGKVYSVPLFSPNHVALFFYHPSMVENVPTTYEEFYNECKRIYEESDGKVYGLVLPMTFTDRMDETFENMVSAAGNPVINWNTGEYEWDSEEMIELFALLTRMWDEGLIMPSSVNFNMKEARERWAAGEAAFLIDGIWNVGITKSNFMPELDDFAVADTITPNGEDFMIYKNPSAGVYFISSSSSHPEEATELLMGMLGDEYQVKIANVQDQPPFNLEALEKADVHQSYIDSVNFFNESIGMQPYLGIRNLDALQIQGNMKTVSPTPCEILNGYFSGAITDWEEALHQYNDNLTAARDEAIEKCQKLGLDVSIDDYIFPNFVYGESYTMDKYSEL